jgi:hypothetical protein
MSLAKGARHDRHGDLLIVAGYRYLADGLLGLNFLDRFRVTFEFDTHTLVLRPPQVSVQPGREEHVTL